MAARRFSVRDTVVAQSVGDETVLLDLASGTYFSLDPVGSLVWQGVADGQALPGLVDILVQRYDVTRERAATEVERLLEEALERGLLAER